MASDAHLTERQTPKTARSARSGRSPPRNLRLPTAVSHSLMAAYSAARSSPCSQPVTSSLPGCSVFKCPSYPNETGTAVRDV